MVYGRYIYTSYGVQTNKHLPGGAQPSINPCATSLTSGSKDDLLAPHGNPRQLQIFFVTLW